MTGAEAASREFGLAALGHGRLDAAALQNGLDRADLPLGIGPCGSLTHRQVQGVRFDALTQALRRLAFRRVPDHRA